ncbi:MAG: hypothetical protein JO146_00990 [Candidatus Eremiobacteraeota bacterium]|nr:hypothetical protein [Candidatus Eremiobacteraeota bacterium]
MLISPFKAPQILRAVPIACAIFLVARACCFADDAATLDSWKDSFHAVWQADTCEGEWQSWNKYWGQVHAFYFGTRGYAGWFANSQKLLARVTDPTANAAVAAQLTSLGRRIGEDWAKQDSCRKVRTNDTFMERATEGGKPALFDWQNQLDKAAAGDSGDGASIQAAIKAINSQMDTIGVGPPAQ